MVDAERAVGIFDSGVGGLTVLRRVAERLPNERLIYLGDTARVPYGTKSPDTVIKYARACARLLTERGLKMLVVACNTASAHALDVLRDELPIPVLGVIDPGARAAVRVTRNRRIGVVGTAGTIASGEYQAAIRALAPQIQVFCKPCPLFVPLAEEGWTEGDVPRMVAQTYLDGLLAQAIDTLVLGCTHYPLLKKVLAEVATVGVHLVDSAEATAEVVEETLAGMGRTRDSSAAGTAHFMVTDDPDGFARIGQRFLGNGLDGHEMSEVEWVDLA